MVRKGYSILLLYPGPRSVAYSSLAFYMIKSLFSSLGIGVKTAFIEDGYVDVDGPLDPRETRAIMVSLPYEVMYADLVKALESIGIPVWRMGRGEEHPIVIGGGPAVTANPLPVIDILDAVLVGELERWLSK